MTLALFSIASRAAAVGSLGCALTRLGQDDYGLRSNRSRRTIAGLAS
jgi:hypothetical protein